MHEASEDERNSNFVLSNFFITCRICLVTSGQGDCSPTEAYLLALYLVLPSRLDTQGLCTPTRLSWTLGAGFQGRTFFFIRSRGWNAGWLITSSAPTDWIFPALESGVCLLAQVNNNLGCEYRSAYDSLTLSGTCGASCVASPWLSCQRAVYLASACPSPSVLCTCPPSSFQDPLPAAVRAHTVICHHVDSVTPSKGFSARTGFLWHLKKLPHNKPRDK